MAFRTATYVSPVEGTNMHLILVRGVQKPAQSMESVTGLEAGDTVLYEVQSPGRQLIIVGTVTS